MLHYILVKPKEAKLTMFSPHLQVTPTTCPRETVNILKKQPHSKSIWMTESQEKNSQNLCHAQEFVPHVEILQTQQP